ncbi:MAG TPA: SUF system NifU family Fe-S cluster assembly protein [Verrucomicrobiae bacterium]|jgi:nitrogen fixation NifU-like protein|nr:SUF system NifU family Fe-S cluster assembly protein [Verrucomicrobiae bacterium]
MADDLSELYQEVILDHSRKPRNFRVMADADRKAEGNNPLCGDHFTVYLKLDGEIIKEATFEGDGCAISKASASMMTDFLKGKKASEAQQQFGAYQQMVTTGKTDEEALGKLCAFAGVHHFPMRVKCAALPWHAMLAALKGDAATSTEEPAKS